MSSFSTNYYHKLPPTLMCLNLSVWARNDQVNTTENYDFTDPGHETFLYWEKKGKTGLYPNRKVTQLKLTQNSWNSSQESKNESLTLTKARCPTNFLLHFSQAHGSHSQKSLLQVTNMPPVEIQESCFQTRDSSQQIEDTIKPNKVSQRSSAIPSNRNGDAEKQLHRQILWLEQLPALGGGELQQNSISSHSRPCSLQEHC